MLNKKKYGLIFLLAFTCLVYNLPYLSASFYPQFIEAFSLSNEQAGRLLSMFGLTATPGYLFGGMLADKFSPKKLIIISMVITSALGISMTFIRSFPLLMACYLGFGASTTFIHWSALMKLIREQAEGGDEGKVFGFFEFCYAVAGAVTSYGILAVLGSLVEMGGFRIVTSIYAGILILLTILVIVLVKDVRDNSASNEFDLKMAGKALAHPVTWLNGLIVMGIFMFGSASTYFNPYICGVFGASLTFGTALTIASRTFLRLIFVPIGGSLLDRLKTPRFLITTSLALIVFCVLMIVIPQGQTMMIPAVGIVILLSCISTLVRPAIYTPIPEAGVPLAITGTAIGICSAVGYSTDLWLYTLCGKWIDRYGNAGYQMVMGLMIAGLVLVLVCAVLLARYEKQHAEEIREANKAGAEAGQVSC